MSRLLLMRRVLKTDRHLQIRTSFCSTTSQKFKPEPITLLPSWSYIWVPLLFIVGYEILIPRQDQNVLAHVVAGWKWEVGLQVFRVFAAN